MIIIIIYNAQNMLMIVILVNMIEDVKNVILALLC